MVYNKSNSHTAIVYAYNIMNIKTSSVMKCQAQWIISFQLVDSGNVWTGPCSDAILFMTHGVQQSQ